MYCMSKIKKKKIIEKYNQIKTYTTVNFVRFFDKNKIRKSIKFFLKFYSQNNKIKKEEEDKISKIEENFDIYPS